MRWKRVLPIKFIASLFSLGSGLLLGREGPTIQFGGNIGKMIKDVFRQPDIENNPLVSAGAAAGLASAFNAPFAGMAGIFASTVRAPLTGLVLAVEMTSNFELILPLIVTTLTASVVTAILGNKPIYTTLLMRTLANTKSA